MLNTNKILLVTTQPVLYLDAAFVVFVLQLTFSYNKP